MIALDVAVMTLKRGRRSQDNRFAQSSPPNMFAALQQGSSIGHEAMRETAANHRCHGIFIVE
jgi:hypothetical protein